MTQRSQGQPGFLQFTFVFKSSQMKKVLTLVLVAVVTAAATYILVHEHFTGRFPWSHPNSDGEVHTTFHSDILKEERDVIIHLPADYDSTARYPVMYVLDGGSEDNHVATKFDILSTAGYAPKTIVVGIPNMTAENRQCNLIPPFMHIDAEDTSSAPGNADQFLSFLESELFPFVENRYPTSGIRLLHGHSRGGLLVMYSLIHKPEMFQARFCYSTPLWRQNDILVKKVSEFLASKDSISTFLYMSAGDNETDNIKGGMKRMAQILSDRSPAGLTWHYDLTPHAVHQNNARISASMGIARWSEARCPTLLKCRTP
jgi:predicted alpha/beta superfamily hydrolase